MAHRRFFRLDDDHPFTGWHMLAIVFTFFGVIIAVNGLMAVAAIGTFPGLIVKNSYVASQNYNEVLASARAQSEAGWRMQIDAPGGVLAGRLVDADGALRRDLAVTAIAGRPSSTRYDRLIELAETVDGYRAVDELPAGIWQVDVEATHGGAVVFR
ncbi:MAG TPA: FixH family protein, partial [Methylomirabilota bacterium]|nr:FixH family protein [Methylomirabilota bacterium]